MGGMKIYKGEKIVRPLLKFIGFNNNNKVKTFIYSYNQWSEIG